MKCITIIGNLGSNAIARATSDGRQLMTFNVAVNQVNADPIWFNCVGSMREKLFPYLVKGQCVAVVGDLSAGTYKDRVDLTVNIDKCELCGSAPAAASQESSQPATQPASQGSYQSPSPEEVYGFTNP